MRASILPLVTHVVRPDQVHKRSSAEVFPHRVASVGEDEIWASVRWPGDHCFYGDGNGLHHLDSTLLLETVRQLTILACHHQYAVDADAQFVMSGLGMDILTTPQGPRDLLLDITARLRGTRVKRSANGVIRSVRLEIEFYDGSTLFASGYGDAMIMTERVYSRLRGGRTRTFNEKRPRPTSMHMHPRQVGHAADSAVVLRPEHTTSRFVLSLDFSNETLFDHPLDHIAGMIPVEATRQIVRRLRLDPSAELSGVEFTFQSTLELDEEVVVDATEIAGKATLQFIQSGRTAVFCVATVAPPIRRSLVRESASLVDPVQILGARKV